MHDCATTADGRIPVGGCQAAGASTDVEGYRPAVDRARDLITGLDDAPLRAVLTRIDHLAGVEMFETAARVRDPPRPDPGIAGTVPASRGAVTVAEIVAARPDGAGGWQLAVVRHGRLAAAGFAALGVPPVTRRGGTLRVGGDRRPRDRPPRRGRRRRRSRWSTGG